MPPIGFVLGAMASFQFGAALAATLFDELGAGGTVFLRVGFGALALALVWRPRLRRVRAAGIALPVVFGLVLAGMNSCFYFSLERIPLGIAVTLEFVGPLTVAILSSRRALDLVWVVLAGAGIVLLSGGDVGGLDPLGVGLALIAGTLWGTYILLGVRLGRAYPGGSGLAPAMIVSAVVLLPVGLADGRSALLDPRLLGLGAAVALLSSAIPYSFELEALRRIPAHVFGVLMSLEPAVAALAGFLVLDQTLAPLQGAAIAMVVAASAGAAAASRQSRRARKAVPSPAASVSKDPKPSGASRSRSVSGET